MSLLETRGCEQFDLTEYKVKGWKPWLERHQVVVGFANHTDSMLSMDCIPKTDSEEQDILEGNTAIESAG